MVAVAVLDITHILKYFDADLQDQSLGADGVHGLWPAAESPTKSDKFMTVGPQLTSDSIKDNNQIFEDN